jgi:hypothetical protein
MQAQPAKIYSTEAPPIAIGAQPNEQVLGHYNLKKIIKQMTVKCNCKNYWKRIEKLHYYFLSTQYSP